MCVDNKTGVLEKVSKHLIKVINTKLYFKIQNIYIFFFNPIIHCHNTNNSSRAKASSTFQLQHSVATITF